MSDCQEFPNTWEEFEQWYGFEDKKEIYTNGSRLIQSFRVKQWLDHTAEPERNIIRCADCKWWDRLEDGHPYGYCRACRSGTHTDRWEISIYRQNRFDFYCADAEPKENEDDDE